MKDLPVGPDMSGANCFRPAIFVNSNLRIYIIVSCLQQLATAGAMQECRVEQSEKEADSNSQEHF